MICEKHKERVTTVCLFEKCQNRYLCLKCNEEHNLNHSDLYKPYDLVFDDKKKFIFYKHTFEE